MLCRNIVMSWFADAAVCVCKPDHCNIMYAFVQYVFISEPLANNLYIYDICIIFTYSIAYYIMYKTWGLPSQFINQSRGYGHSTRKTPGVSLPSGYRTRNLQICITFCAIFCILTYKTNHLSFCPILLYLKK